MRISSFRIIMGNLHLNVYPSIVLLAFPDRTLVPETPLVNSIDPSSVRDFPSPSLSGIVVKVNAKIEITLAKNHIVFKSNRRWQV